MSNNVNNNNDENKLESNIAKIAKHLESLRFAEYVELLEKPRRLIMTNFLAGVARGFGMAVGATIVFALIIEILSRLIVFNIPFIGNIIADIVNIVESHRR